MPDTIEVAEETVRGLTQEIRALRETTERLREELREASATS